MHLNPRTVHIPQADLKIVRCVLSRSEVEREDLLYVINCFSSPLRPMILRLLARDTGWRNLDKEIKYISCLRMSLLNKNVYKAYRKKITYEREIQVVTNL